MEELKLKISQMEKHDLRKLLSFTKSEINSRRNNIKIDITRNPENTLIVKIGGIHLYAQNIEKIMYEFGRYGKISSSDYDNNAILRITYEDKRDAQDVMHDMLGITYSVRKTLI